MELGIQVPEEVPFFSGSELKKYNLSVEQMSQSFKTIC